MEEHLHILIAEDEPSCLRPLSMILRRAGYEVSTATNGTEALEILEANQQKASPVNVVLCDIFMPDMDGVSVIREMRSRQISVPVVIMTGCADDTLLKALGRENCRHVIAKPFYKEEVLRVIAAVLSPESDGGSPCLSGVKDGFADSFSTSSDHTGT